MDSVLCDELLEEILHLLLASSSPSVALVSRRWLAALRSSTASLSLRLPNPNPDPNLSLSSILSHYPSLSSLTVFNRDNDLVADSHLFTVATCPSSHRLTHLRLLFSAPISPAALLSNSQSFARLTDLSLPCPRPLSFHWLYSLPSLKSLTILRTFTLVCTLYDSSHRCQNNNSDCSGEHKQLTLESLSISGIRACETAAAWLWRRCANLRRLQLRSCDGIGDSPSAPTFPLCLHNLHELDLRTCRTIAGHVLLLAANHCLKLTSLLLYDGGSCDALHQFIIQRGAALRTLDLRLPLDLDNRHLSAIATDRPGLAVLRLQSCCLATGDGLRELAHAPAGSAIEELALVNCDIVEREPGLLTTLGQSMRRIRRLDLSHNEKLADKEMGAMLASCGNLLDIRLEGCRGLTDATLLSLIKCCGKQLDRVDISRCPGITVVGVEQLVLNATQLNCILVEEEKVSEAAGALLSRRGIKIG